MRLKDISQLNPKYEGELIDGDVSFVPMESLRCGSIDLQEISFSEAKGKYTFFANDDLLIAKVTPCFENGNIAIAKDLKEGIGFGSSEIFVLRTNELALNTYIFYVSQTSRFQDMACATMCGVGGLKRISPLIMRTYELDMPSIETQHKIVSYLDEKCGDIDSQISLLEKKRGAYTQLKKSIINKAVTQGLNPNVTMRPSEIDWIGSIPAHWKVKRGKDFLTITSGYPADSELFTTDESKIPLVRIRDIQNTTTEVFYDGDYPEWAIISTGDLLIGMDGDFNVAMWKGDTALLNQRVCKLESETVDLKYVFYSIVFPLNNLNAKTNSTTVKHLSVMGIQNFFFAIPPFAEQRAISCYLDKKCCEIDAAIENIGKQIDAYKRLKKSLINEVVTGKRAV